MSGTIPYTVEPHPETGLNNVRLGVWLFLASEVMLFGGLFSAYFMLRAGATEPWLPFRDHLGAAARNTLLLLAATGTFMSAARSAGSASAGASSRAAFSLRLVASVLFALAFCAAKVSEYYGLFDRHLVPSTSTHYATYFLLTGVHLLHVAGGALVTLWLLLTGPRVWAMSPSTVRNRLQATAMYWYFVDAVWLVLVVVLYVV